MPAACKAIGLEEQTYYRWRKSYGELKVDQAHPMLRQELIRRGMLDSAGYGLQDEPPQSSVPTRSEQSAP